MQWNRIQNISQINFLNFKFFFVKKIKLIIYLQNTNYPFSKIMICHWCTLIANSRFTSALISHLFITNSIRSWHSHQTSQRHFPSLAQLLLHIHTSHLSQILHIAQHTFQRSSRSIPLIAQQIFQRSSRSIPLIAQHTFNARHALFPSFSFITTSCIAAVIYPEWPPRQCGGLVFRRLSYRIPLTTLLIFSAHLHRAIVALRGYCDVNGDVNGQSIGSILSLTPLLIDECGDCIKELHVHLFNIIVAI